MDELTTVEKQLPSTLQELSKFVLVGREKLVAVRAEIRAIKKVGLAKEVHEQKLKEAQDIAEAVLDAEMQMGKLTAAMPKASGGDHGNQYTGGKSNTDDTFAKEKPKEEQLADIGITRQQASCYETLAKHPEIVEQAKESARRSNDIVNRSSVLKAIANSTPQKKSVEEQAKEEHKQFEEKVAQDVVTLADIKKDKQNQKVIQLGAAKELIKMLNSILDFGSHNSVDDMALLVSQSFSSMECEIFAQECVTAAQIITQLQNVFQEGIV